ncbi:MAG: hypothetical protein EA402_09150 [Planctomycetota bacterium]|nr:MAG: hypothetical protein EA402_09150 [Planctomycetota bacterium]
MRRQHILLVTKQSTRDRLGQDDMQRLVSAGVADPQRLEAAHRQHQEAVDQVRSAIGAALVTEAWVGHITPDHLKNIDLVICVGGDGTVFGVQRWIAETPLISVNSDPERSVGHFTRLRANQVAATLEAWRAGHSQEQALPRLAARILDQAGRGPLLMDTHPILNDCLFTNHNPAEMSRYVIDTGEDQELHYSSGVWVATAAGSTAAIASAGFGTTYDPAEAALLFHVREPFSNSPLHLNSGSQCPPQGLSLTAAIPGMQISIDGAHSAHALPPGAQVQFRAHPTALRLILPG